MNPSVDPSASIKLEHTNRLRFAELERYRLLMGRPIPAHDTKPIAGWQLVRSTSNRTQGERLARLAAWVGRRAGRPIRVLELGTSVGISGCYLLAGMAEAHGGHLATFEGRDQIAGLAQQRLERFVGRFELSYPVSFEIVVGSFGETFEPYLRACREPLDLVFIDGHHQAEPTLRYHALVRERISPSGVIIHDDIAWSPGMVTAWASIAEQERERLIVEQWQGGRPSRGIIFCGEPSLPHHVRMDIDGAAGRFARSAWRVLSRFKPN
jgi:predicted O-methyltransferase YrrM